MKLISWQQIMDEEMTKQEQTELKNRVKLKIALRELKEERKRQGLTQVKLASLAKVPRTTISKIESGAQNVSIEKVMTVAAAMGKTIEINLVTIS